MQNNQKIMMEKHSAGKFGKEKWKLRMEKHRKTRNMETWKLSSLGILIEKKKVANQKET